LPARLAAQYFFIRWLTALRAAADIRPRFRRGRSIIAAGSEDMSIRACLECDAERALERTFWVQRSLPSAPDSGVPRPFVPVPECAMSVAPCRLRQTPDHTRHDDKDIRCVYEPRRHDARHSRGAGDRFDRRRSIRPCAGRTRQATQLHRGRRDAWWHGLRCGSRLNGVELDSYVASSRG